MAPKRAAPEALVSPKRVRHSAHSTSSTTTTNAKRHTWTRVSELPPAVFARILAFAVPGFVPVEHCAPQCPNLPIRKFRAIAGVSQNWQLAARAVVQQFLRRTLDWELLAAPTARDVSDLLSELEQRGDELLDLRITISANVRDKDVASLDWREVFRCCPALQRLDVRGVPLEHRALRRMLPIAATKCPSLEALVLSRRTLGAKQTAINATYERLADALEAWSERRRTSRIVQVTLPDRAADEAEAPSAALLPVVTAACPALAYWDGWKANYRVTDDAVVCNEKWYVSPQVWTQVWTKLSTSIREFNWAVAPFHDAYVERFAAVRKPALRHLCLTVSESWSWKDFRSQCEQEGDDDDSDNETKGDDDETSRLPDELIAPPTTASLCAMTHALPRLEQLHVILHTNLDVPESVDPEAFNDTFLETLTHACPELRELKLVQLGATDEAMNLFESITHDGIAALSHHAQLQDVVLTGIQGEALDTFAFIEHWREPKRQRTISIAIAQSENERAFYNEALDLLAKIYDAFAPPPPPKESGDDEGINATIGSDEAKASAPVPIAPIRFAIQLRNLTEARDFGLLKRFCKHWNRLVRKVAVALPWLSVAAEADGVLETGLVSAFRTLSQVVISTGDANVSVVRDLNVLEPVAVVPATPRRRSAKSAQSDTHNVRRRRTNLKRLEFPSSGEEGDSSSDAEDDGSGYGSAVEGSGADGSGVESERESEGSEAALDDEDSIFDEDQDDSTLFDTPSKSPASKPSPAGKVRDSRRRSSTASATEDEENVASADESVEIE